jgi:hypothetical protein
MYMQGEEPVSSQYSDWLRRYTKVKCLYQVSTMSGYGGIPRWSACTKSVQWVVTGVYQGEVHVSRKYSEWLRRYTKVKCLFEVSTVSSYGGIPRWSACIKSVQWVVTEVYQGEVPVPSQYSEWLRRYTYSLGTGTSPWYTSVTTHCTDLVQALHLGIPP